MNNYEELSEKEKYRRNLKLAKQVLAIAIFLLAFFFASLFMGCRDDGCTPETTQCNGDVVEICNADNNWEDIVNCADYDMVCDEEAGDCK